MKNYSGQLVTTDQYVELTKRVEELERIANLTIFQKIVRLLKTKVF